MTADELRIAYFTSIRKPVVPWETLPKRIQDIWLLLNEGGNYNIDTNFRERMPRRDRGKKIQSRRVPARKSVPGRMVQSP